MRSIQTTKGKQNPTVFPKTALTKDIIKYLYYMEGYTLQEIADTFGVTKETIRKLMDKWGIRRFTNRTRK